MGAWKGWPEALVSAREESGFKFGAFEGSKQELFCGE